MGGRPNLWDTSQKGQATCQTTIIVKFQSCTSAFLSVFSHTGCLLIIPPLWFELSRQLLHGLSWNFGALRLNPTNIDDSPDFSSSATSYNGLVQNFVQTFMVCRRCILMTLVVSWRFLSGHHEAHIFSPKCNVSSQLLDGGQHYWKSHHM